MTNPKHDDPMLTVPPLAMGRPAPGESPIPMRGSKLISRAKSASTFGLLLSAAAAWLLLLFIVVSPWAGVQRASFLPEVAADVVAAAYFDRDTWFTLSVSGFENVVRMTVATLMLLAVVVAVLVRRAGATARHGGMALLALAPVGIYLAADDAEFDRPVNFAEFDATAPGADEAERLLLVWAPPAEQAKAFKEPAVVAKLRPGPEQSEWTELVRRNREQISAAWEEAAPLRVWWAAWNAHPEVADNTRVTDHPPVSFRVLGTYSYLAGAKAFALAEEGYVSEAVALLAGLIEGGAKLEKHSRTLVRSVMGLTVRKRALQTLDVILSRTVLEPAARAELARRIALGQAGEAGARRLVAVEFAQLLETCRAHEAGERRAFGGWLGGWAGPVIFNPRRTFNEVSGIVAELEERAARRDFASFDTVLRERSRSHEPGFGFKNTAGRMMIGGYWPALANAPKLYWETEDAAAAAIARLSEEAGE